MATTDNRQYYWSTPVTHNGIEYPANMETLLDSNGNSVDRNVFADAQGNRYFVNDDNTLTEVIPYGGTLDEVKVTGQRRYNEEVPLSAFSRHLTMDKDKTRVSEIPYSPYHEEKPSQNFFTMQLPSNVKDNIFTRILYSLDSEKEPFSQYKNSQSPYSYEDDIDPNGKVYRGLLSTGNEKASRLGGLGLVKVGNNKYNLYDESGNLIKQCAKTRNELEKMLGHPTTNNAWDTFGVYGDSTLFNGYLPKVGPYTWPSYVVQNQIAASRTQKALENLQLQTGDVVDLYSPVSHYAKQAYTQGTLNRSNSHTGVVFQPYPNVKSKTYIIHNVNGNISVDPIGEFLLNEDNLLPRWRMTGFHRPGTKEHPYLRDGKPAHL